MIKISLAKTLQLMTDLRYLRLTDYFEEVYTGYGVSKWTNSTTAAFLIFQGKVLREYVSTLVQLAELKHSLLWVCVIQFV